MGMGGAGIQTAALGFGGIATNAPAVGTANTESYDGSSWTEVNNLSNDREITVGVGLYTAALCMGNDPPYNATVESWDGTNWTSGTNLPAPRGYGAAFGTQTAAIYTGGYTDGDGSVSGSTLYWNGSSWTETGDLNTTRAFLSSSTNGTYTAAIVAGGPLPGGSPVESWNGSSWTEVNELNTARVSAGGGGTQTSGLYFGGFNPTATSALTESWDGTNWTESGDLSTARGQNNKGGGGATNTAGIAYGGANAPGSTTPTFVTSTEEFSEPPATQAKLVEGMIFLSGGASLKGFGKAAGIPAGTWASGGTLNAGHGYGTGFGGAQTAAVCCFGGYPTHTNNTETYNGTAWTEVNEGNTARRNLGSFGVLTSGLAFAGGPPFGSAITEAWDGTSWTETGDLPNGTYNNRGIGTSSSAGLCVGGVDNTSGRDALVFEWSGSSWSEISEMNTVRESGSTANAGSITAGLVFGGESPSQTVNTELWNGSSWTELNNLNTARSDAGGNGISTQALCFGGGTPAPATQATNNESWNGTSWSEINDLGTGLSSGIAPAGGSVSGMASGGQSAPGTQNTVSQEFDAPATLSTVTVS
jgi:hypothetical protein